MTRKFSKVLKAESRQAFTGTYTAWILTLDCGHEATAIKSKRGWRLRTKPAPTRVVCRQCESEAK